jgi:hypothetical protein
MRENRRSPRQLTLKTGAIIDPDDGKRIPCAVLNLSETGAGLLVASTEKTPTTFDLVLDPDGRRRTCTVAWKSATKIGVSFTDSGWRDATPIAPDIEAKR